MRSSRKDPEQSEEEEEEERGGGTGRSGKGEPRGALRAVPGAGGGHGEGRMARGGCRCLTAARHQRPERRAPAAAPAHMPPPASPGAARRLDSAEGIIPLRPGERQSPRTGRWNRLAIPEEEPPVPLQPLPPAPHG